MTKQQRGYIFRKGKFWFLRYADTVLRDGKSVRVQLCKKLAPYSDAYPVPKNRCGPWRMRFCFRSMPVLKTCARRCVSWTLSRLCISPRSKPRGAQALA